MGERLRSQKEEKSDSCDCIVAGRHKGRIYRIMLGADRTGTAKATSSLNRRRRQRRRAENGVFFPFPPPLDPSASERVSAHAPALRGRLERHRTCRQPVQRVECFCCAGFEGGDGGVGVELVNLRARRTRLHQLTTPLSAQAGYRREQQNAPSSTLFRQLQLLPLPPSPILRG